MTATSSQISSFLVSQSLPRPSQQWLNTILSTQRPSTPSKAVLATCKVRLLASDLTTPGFLDISTSHFPQNLSDPSIQQLKLAGSIHAQILGVEDLSKSRWEQIEAIEAFERGETTKGREVIRLAPSEEGDDGLPHVATSVPTGSSGPHRLVLQDCKGQTVYGIEVRAIPKVGTGMDIGMKICLKDCVVARGMVLLEPQNVAVLGGRIEHLHKIWQTNRKKELRDAIDGQGGQ